MGATAATGQKRVVAYKSGSSLLWPLAQPQPSRGCPLWRAMVQLEQQHISHHRYLYHLHAYCMLVKML